MTSLDDWLEHQYRHSAAAMLRSISCGVVKTRPGFGQTIIPKRGSIVASPVPGAYDPDPDYFFHWVRDSAIVVDALRVLHKDRTLALDALPMLADFVRFSGALRELDGRLLADAPWRQGVSCDFHQYLRTDEDLSCAHGAAIAGDTRVNPDGTLDISRWPRPQYDGPALRALTLLRWIRDVDLPDAVTADLHALLREDVEFTRRHWRRCCFDIWEEEYGLHYYTLRMGAAAQAEAAVWLEQRGDARDAGICRDEARAILTTLDGFWCAARGYYRSRTLRSLQPSVKELDMSVILSAIHAGGSGSRHTPSDVRMHATLAQLEAVFTADYSINRDLAKDCAPAMGRYRGDVYYSGGAYYFATLAAAEFCFRAARDSSQSRALVRRGDAFLETVRRYTPSSGDLSEQFDQHTGVARGAQQLAWSYAALISCTDARRQL